MGRQAKLKKQRHQAANTPPPPKPESAAFVKQLEHRGYAWQQVARSPDLPDDQPQPEV